MKNKISISCSLSFCIITTVEQSPGTIEQSDFIGCAEATIGVITRIFCTAPNCWLFCWTNLWKLRTKVAKISPTGIKDKKVINIKCLEVVYNRFV